MQAAREERRRFVLLAAVTFVIFCVTRGRCEMEAVLQFGSVDAARRFYCLIGRQAYLNARQPHSALDRLQMDACSRQANEGPIAMHTLAKQIFEHAAGLPEGTPLVAKELLHLGSRAAVDQVLSRLVRRGTLLRAGRGIYVLPVESRFGTRAPSAVKMVEGLAKQRGETIVSHGAAAANALGLTTQVPMRAVYLTSGPSRRLKLGAQMIEFRHAPIWQLIFP
jgi:hypothetical protein